jgi:hypothetical protein
MSEAVTPRGSGRTTSGAWPQLPGRDGQERER